MRLRFAVEGYGCRDQAGMAFARDLGGQYGVLMHAQIRQSSTITCVGAAGCEERSYKQMLTPLGLP